MSKNKQLWFLAGGNEAGKSTFYKTPLQQIAKLDNRQVIVKVASLSEWAKRLLEDYLD